ncbi:MAG: hypothetical protein WCF01_11630 [Nitrososphaeraceae archaeon]
MPNESQSQRSLKGTNSSWTNPLALAPAKWYEFYKRIRLFPWWITYNAGIAEEAILRKKLLNKVVPWDFKSNGCRE